MARKYRSNLWNFLGNWPRYFKKKKKKKKKTEFDNINRLRRLQTRVEFQETQKVDD